MVANLTQVGHLGPDPMDVLVRQGPDIQHKSPARFLALWLNDRGQRGLHQLEGWPQRRMLVIGDFVETLDHAVNIGQHAQR